MAITYDPPETLGKFAASRGITFPLLSDAGSAVIKRYGLFNATIEPGHRFYGIPHPGTFIVDRKGLVQSRYFEPAYQERNTVASILVREGVTPFGPAATSETAHLRVTSAISDEATAPGRRHTLVHEVTPKPGMHLYAPGKHDYQVINVVVDPQPWLRVEPVTYPASEIYHFKPLDERVEVYMKPFTLKQEVTVLATPDVQKLLAGQTEVTISGKIEYQACDDAVCYRPAEVPFRWTLPLSQLDRRPPGQPGGGNGRAGMSAKVIGE